MRGRPEQIHGTTIYVSMPQNPDATGAILLIHEWWGLDNHMMEMADGFAALGYKAVAIDLFGGKTTTDPDVAERHMQGDRPQESLVKLQNVLRWMRDPEGLGAKRVVTIGFCFGGGYSLQCALQFGDLVDGSVIYYGQPVTDPEALRRCRVPLLGIFASQDRWITPELVQRFETACRKAGVSLESHHYEADHAFVNPINPSRHDPRLAREAETVTRGFFKRVLG